MQSNLCATYANSATKETHMMTIDRIVMAFAGNDDSRKPRTVSVVGSLVAAARGFCRAKPAAGRLHAILSPGDAFEKIRRALGSGLLARLTAASR